MIDDPLLLREKDYKRAEKVIKNNNNKIILIGGTSGSSKSELGYCIRKLLFDKNKSSFCISLDDYYHIIPSIRDLNRKKMGLNSVGLSEIDWDAVYRIYNDFENKNEICFRRTHKFLDAIEHDVINSDDIDYLIFEGLYANYIRKNYKNNLSVYLEGNPEQTMKFRKLRGKENINDIFRQSVVQREFNVVSQLKRHTDLVLPFEE